MPLILENVTLGMSHKEMWRVITNVRYQIVIINVCHKFNNKLILNICYKEE